MTANAPTNDGYWTDAGNYATSFAGGSGTSSDPYLIETPQQLAYLSYLVNNSSTNSQYASLYYKQTANLDMSAYWWDAIGTSTYPFKGYYDGGDYTISNLLVNDNSNYEGLFGNVRSWASSSSGSVYGREANCIKNINLVNVNIIGYDYLGGIAGFIKDCVIHDCCVSGEIVSLGESNCVGGLVGSGMDNSSIYNCFNSATISSEGKNVSGIVGGFNTYGSIYNCYNEGKVLGKGYVGGIAGDFGCRESDYNVEIRSCYNLGDILFNGERSGVRGLIGGVVGCAVGYNSGDVNVKNCYNRGNITGGGVNGTGGIVGDMQATTITNCYNTGVVEDDDNASYGVYVGSIAGRMYYYSGIYNCFSAGSSLTIVENSQDSTNTNNKIDANYENCLNLDWYTTTSNWYSSYPWDFESIWAITEGVNDGLPYLIDMTWAMSFTITYHPNGASGNEVVESKVGSESYTIRSNMFTRSGYNFTGWNTQANGGGQSYSAGSSYSELANLDLYAQWSRITYTIKYNKNASDATGSMANTTKYYGTNVTLRWNGFSRTGYSFAGWATEKNGDMVYSNGATYKANANVTLYAKWTAHKYIVKFNGNGSTSGSMKEQSFEYGTEQKLTSNAFKKTGFTFSKWTRNADGTGTSYTNGQSVKNLTSTDGAEIKLYAQWKANNEAKYDSAGDYWYIENGKIPQTKVTNSTLISNLNKATTNGGNYYIAGEPLTAKVYNGTEYCKWNNNWYEVEPIRWRLDASSS